MTADTADRTADRANTADRAMTADRANTADRAMTADRTADRADTADRAMTADRTDMADRTADRANTPDRADPAGPTADTAARADEPGQTLALPDLAGPQSLADNSDLSDSAGGLEAARTVSRLEEAAGAPGRSEEAAGASGRTEQATGTDEPLAAHEIRAMRERIDEIDQQLIDLWLERASLSQQVGRTRMASGGTRLVLSREREIVERFREALGPDGAQVALMILRAGRGPL